MERIGEVTAAVGEWLEITFCRPADCEKCHACMGGNKAVSVRVKGDANVGDRVVVEMSERTVEKASLIAYGLPLVGLLGGMFLGDWLLPDKATLGALLGGVAGLALPLTLIYLTEKRRHSDPAWDARIIRIIPHSDET